MPHIGVDRKLGERVSVKEHFSRGLLGEASVESSVGRRVETIKAVEAGDPMLRDDRKMTGAVDAHIYRQQQRFLQNRRS